MSWLLSQHVLVYRVDSHTNHLDSGALKESGSTWEMSLLQGIEVTDALSHYSANELDDKLERITGHGSTKPNDSRFPNQPEKNRRVELSLVLEMSKEDLAQYE
jgi:flagellar motor protein MotB